MHNQMNGLSTQAGLQYTVRSGLLTPRRALRTTQLVFFALLLVTSPAIAQPADSLVLQAKQLLKEGELEGSVDKMLLARVTFERAASDDSLSTLAHYYAAYAAHQVIGQLLGDNPDTPKRELLVHIDYAIAHLDEATQRNPSFAEAWALLASLYGRKISLRPLQGMSLGPKSNRAMKTAQKLAPTSPRVVLLEAVGDFNTPRMWGGNKKRAIRGFQKAAELFQEEVISDPLQPSWGRSAVYAWMGIAYMEAGDLPKAREALQKALSIDPEFGWVKYELMPSLEQLEGAASK